MKGRQAFPPKRGKKWELLVAECTLKSESAPKMGNVYMSTNKRKLLTGKKEGRDQRNVSECTSSAQMEGWVI